MYYSKMAKGLYSNKNRVLRKALVKAREASGLTQEDIAEKLSRP